MLSGGRSAFLYLGMVLSFWSSASWMPVGGCPHKCTCIASNVDCHGLGLKTVPRDIPRNAERLDLEKNNITRITKTDFTGLKNLRVLHLEENQISVIERGAFQDLKQLERLLEAEKGRSKVPYCMKDIRTPKRAGGGETGTCECQQNNFGRRLNKNKLQVLPELLFQNTQKLTRLLISLEFSASQPKSYFVQTGMTIIDSKSFGKIVALSKAGSLESTGVKNGLSLSFSELENNLKGRVDGKSRAKPIAPSAFADTTPFFGSARDIFKVFTEPVVVGTISDVINDKLTCVELDLMRAKLVQQKIHGMSFLGVSAPFQNKSEVPSPAAKQALLMTKYAMNLENLQPCGGGKLLSGLPPVFVCLSDSPLDLLCAKFPLHSRAVAQSSTSLVDSCHLPKETVKLGPKLGLQVNFTKQQEVSFASRIGTLSADVLHLCINLLDRHQLLLFLGPSYQLSLQSQLAFCMECDWSFLLDSLLEEYFQLRFQSKLNVSPSLDIQVSLRWMEDTIIYKARLTCSMMRVFVKLLFLTEVFGLIMCPSSEQIKGISIASVVIHCTDLGLFRQNRAILLRIFVRKQGLDIPIAAHHGAAAREEQTWALQLDPPREIPST
ncbi:hypothetical protein Q9966_001786 [Columba livia]|nr:hypothetical protein Q9966_001786 [Columba livia]